LFELLCAVDLIALHFKYFKKFTLRIGLILLALLEILKQAIFKAILWLLPNCLKTLPQHHLKSEAYHHYSFSSAIIHDETSVIKTLLKLSN
jgi:hypothetical protein